MDESPYEIHVLSGNKNVSALHSCYRVEGAFCVAVECVMSTKEECTAVIRIREAFAFD